MKRQDIIVNLKKNKKEQVSFIKGLLKINKMMIEEENQKKSIELQQLKDIVFPAIRNAFSLCSAIKSISWSQSRLRNKDLLLGSTSETVEIDDLKVWLNEEVKTEANKDIKRSRCSIQEIKNYSNNLFNILNNINFLLSIKKNTLFLLGESIEIEFFKDEIKIVDFNTQEMSTYKY